MAEPLLTGHETTVCALAECDVAVAQPPRGGRRRLYCSNAHRAEARRRRIAGSPEVAPGDVVASALQRLDAVLEDLRAHEAVLRSVDPNRQAVDAARIRAEASAAVLDAQRVAAKATEDAARSGERLAAGVKRWPAPASKVLEACDGLLSGPVGSTPGLGEGAEETFFSVPHKEVGT